MMIMKITAAQTTSLFQAFDMIRSARRKAAVSNRKKFKEACLRKSKRDYHKSN